VRHVTEVDGAVVDLTYVEFEILSTLIASPGRVFSRNQLLDAVWGSSDFREPRTVDVHVRHLREKIEQDPAMPARIQTVRGVGYRFEG
jgi:DNA-binding response OmpR family regulator